MSLQPKDNQPVYIHFWVDNFDIKVNKQVGGGSIDGTTLWHSRIVVKEFMLKEINHQSNGIEIAKYF